MTATTVDVSTSPDGTLVIHLRGILGAGDAPELSRALVQAIRHTRPLRLIVDLAGVHDLDPVNLGALAAACQLGDDHRVTVSFDRPSASLAELLRVTGVPRQRLRNIA